jgi:predicted porin
MKKSLLALAVLGAFAGAASAQSSVTLSGIVDAGVKYNNGDYTVGASQSGYSAFTLSGREDLGGGMAAIFLLNHRFNIANGQLNTATGNAALPQAMWRNAWVGLSGGFGDFRIGRILMPLQDMNGGFDAFDTGYVASTHTGGLTATIRANNALYYRSPNLGGLTFHAAYAAAEGQYITETQGSFAGSASYSIPTALLNKERPMGFNVRYAAGPLNVGVAYDVNTADYDTTGIYGSFNFGFMTLMGQYETGTVNNVAGTAKEDGDLFSISAKIPMGAITWKVGYVNVSSDKVNGDANKFGFGAEYSLSKRTSLYSNIGKASGDRVSGVQEDTKFDIGMTHRF